MESQTSSSMPKQEQASLNQTSHPYGAVPPCYGNFDKQSTAPKQPLVTILSPMVIPIFVAQNPQLYYTTTNISVLEVADPREPLTPSLETTYATPPQASVGATIDMAGKSSGTAIPHLARPIPLRLDYLCINTLPLCYRQHQSIPPGQEEFLIRSHSLNRDSACFFEAILLYLLQTQPVEDFLPAQISIMELLSTSQVHRAAKGSSP